MSVVEQLGVADLAQGLAEARQLWQDWVEQDPRLASAPAVDGLRDWLMLVGIDAADEVLHALVQMGSPSGKRLPASGVGRGLGVAARRNCSGPTGAGRPDGDGAHPRRGRRPRRPSPTRHTRPPLPRAWWTAVSRVRVSAIPASSISSSVRESIWSAHSGSG